MAFSRRVPTKPAEGPPSGRGAAEPIGDVGFQLGPSTGAAADRPRSDAALEQARQPREQEEEEEDEAARRRAKADLEFQKAAALQRARLKASDGSTRPQQPFTGSALEAAKERARQRARESALHTQVNIDKAGSSVENEKTLRAAALERAFLKTSEAVEQSPLTGAALDAAKVESQAGIDKARAAFEAEKARKAAALERARQAKEREAAEQQPLSGVELEAAKAQSQAGIDKARAALEAEKARNAAALERARQAKEREVVEQQPLSGAELEAAETQSQAGIDTARAAFEAEKARRAAALELARQAKGREVVEQHPLSEAELGAAETQSQAGIDKATVAVEAEAARKVVALERARQAQERDETERHPLSGVEFEAAKTQSQAGIDKARAAFEAEKTRKAAALEPARQATETQDTEQQLLTGEALDVAKAQSQAGIDMAKAAFEAEQVRKTAALERAHHAQQREAEEQQPLTGEALEGAKAQSLAGIDKARAAYEAEKARKAAALERARLAKEREAAEQALEPDQPRQQPLTGDAFEATKAQSQAGIDTARGAFEAEKARKLAAMQQARLPKEHEGEQQETSTGAALEAAKAQSQAGIDKARAAFEAEKARKAAALDRARQAKEMEVGEKQPLSGETLEAAKAQSQVGIDKAKSAYEAERARKAAALERARLARETESAEQHASTDPRLEAAKAQSQAGIDKAKAAFEAEKARKAAALERARLAKQAAADQQQGHIDVPLEAAKMQSQAGIDEATAAFEAEEARKAAALESARMARSREEPEQPNTAAARLETTESPGESAADEAQASFAARRAAAIERARRKSGRPLEAANSESQRGSHGTPEDTFEERAATRRQDSTIDAEAPGGPAAFEPASQLGGMAGLTPGQARSFGPAAGQVGQPRSFGPSASSSAAEAKDLSGPSRAKPERAGGASEAASVESRAAEAPPQPQLPLEAGLIVCIEGLSKSPELNGTFAETLSFDAERGRWQVRAFGHEDTPMNLKEVNLRAVTEEEFKAWQDEQGKAPGGEDYMDVLQLLNSKISGDSMATAARSAPSSLEKGPGASGNTFDVRMAEEPESGIAARKIVQVLKEKGVCLCEANAPQSILMSAFEEGDRLWRSGAFAPTMQDMEASELEEELWKNMLYQDEAKAAWISEAAIGEFSLDGLGLVTESMRNLALSLQSEIGRKLGIRWNTTWDSMLACYTGDRTYAFHLDNPQGDHGLPDNGVRLSLCYFINPHWDPETGYNGGGLDLYLTDPSGPPSSAASARRSHRLRVAPHADTLVAFLSQRVAHQVVETKGDDVWLCLWMWCVDEQIVSEFPQKMLERREVAFDDDDDDDHDDVVSLGLDDDELDRTSELSECD